MPMNEHSVYLDHNATTPLDPAASRIMLRMMDEEFGNPSSPYALGVHARKALDRARDQVARLLGCNADEVVFTSGGSESNNMVLKGVVDLKRPGQGHIVTTRIEHPAVLNPALFLMDLGTEVTFLSVDRFGRVDPEAVRKALRSDTLLISVMLANNETGTLQPLREISEIARERGVLLHTDAAQAVGKIPVNVRDLGVDFLSVAGHKLYGPKGIGALFVRAGLTLTPLIHGAGQEGGRRAGTENTILAAGFGEACRVAEERMASDFERMKVLRDRLQALLFSALEGLVLNGHPEHRLPNTLNISFPGIEGARILEGIPDVIASTGAACHDRSVRLSHVLSAMGVPPEVGMGALRLTLGRGNDVDQVEKAAGRIVHRIMEISDGK